MSIATADDREWRELLHGWPNLRADDLVTLPESAESDAVVLVYDKDVDPVRLAARGVEIRVCEDDGPHKKYLPYAQSSAHHPRPLVPADDDVLYPPEWLLGLARAHDRHPGEILAYRVDRIAVRDGQVRPYAEWDRATDATPSPRNVAVGVKGILYPAEFVAGGPKGDLLADLGSQYLPLDLSAPVGLVTGVLGGGYLLWLLARGR
ncbi:hypothetical protein IAE22_27750 [Bacillus sp. S34]|nr:hypothetical protein [Bacillus sp. S34]